MYKKKIFHDFNKTTINYNMNNNINKINDIIYKNSLSNLNNIAKSKIIFYERICRNIINLFKIFLQIFIFINAFFIVFVAFVRLFEFFE